MHRRKRHRTRSYLYDRHALPVRVMHWINVIAFTALFMSGLQIFNAHPALNFGKSSYDGRPPVLEIGARQADDGALTRRDARVRRGVRHDGVPGRHARRRRAARAVDVSAVADAAGPAVAVDGALVALLLRVAVRAQRAVLRRSTRSRAAIWRATWRPRARTSKGIGASVRDHLRFRHPAGEAAKRYNVLQKLAYLVVIFGLLPLAILMGFAMSPWLNSLFTGWVDVVGGRQSARSIHFIVAWLLVGFVAIHVFEVVISGLWNNLRSMITGRYRVTAEASHD